MKSIVVDFSEDMIRTALVDDGRLIEIMIDGYENKMSLGNIFIGIVKNILPNGFAFIDIGGERNVFLNLNDNKEAGLFDKKGKAEALPLKQGQRMLVQLLKNSAMDKSEVVTTQLAFSDQNVVLFMSGGREIGVSKKIRNNKERARLKRLAEECMPDGFGVIMRTNSKNKTDAELCESIKVLNKRAADVIKRSTYAKAPALIYKEEFILGSTLKELYTADIDEIVINIDKYSAEVASAISEMGGDAGIVKLYGGEGRIFSLYSIESQIARIMSQRVSLKSGGFLIIEQTEACAVIDVNSGKYTSGKGLRKSILKTNLEAAVAIADEIRLRNLSGLIIIDFINMRESEDKARLRKTLSDEVKKDRIAINVVGMTRLGLMQLTRKKTRRPVLELLTDICPECGGIGRVRHKKAEE